MQNNLQSNSENCFIVLGSGAYPKVEHLKGAPRCSTRDKHSSLFEPFVSYAKKGFETFVKIDKI
jgi:hypothetical protein